MASVFIVEDEVLIAEDIKNSLESMGFEVKAVASTGEDAVHRVGVDPPDVVMMDIHLAGKMDGIEAAEKIYQQYNVPVIFLTAFSDDTLLERAAKVGSFGYLIKPFDDRELKAMLEIVLYKVKIDAEKQQLEKKALLAQKHESLRTLAAGIAHRFNNILTVVLGNLEMAAQCCQGDNSKEYIERAIRGAADAAKLSGHMVTYLGQFPASFKIVDFDSTINELVETLMVTTKGRAKLVFKPAGEPLFCRCSKELVALIVNNLVENSAESIVEGNGAITVSITKDYCNPEDMDLLYQSKPINPGHFVVLEVSDTGRGMDQETLEKIFDPFFSTNFMGRGLGLSSVLGAITSHKGFLTLQSEKNKGTVAQVYFPAVGEQTKG